MTTTQVETASAPRLANRDGDGAARLHFLLSIPFLLVAVVAGATQAIQLSAPTWLSGISQLSYGRLVPAFTGALLFGWVSLVQLGVIYALLPRLTGSRLAPVLLTRLSALGVAGGAAGGVVAVLLGENRGLWLFEFPLWADSLLLIGFLAAAVAVTVSIRNRAEPHLYVSARYYVAGLWWMVLTLAAVSFLPVRGLDLAVLTRFGISAIALGWMLLVGIGSALYLIPRITGNPLYSTRLAELGWLACLGVLPWLGGHLLTFGPIPAWLQTISAMFAIGMAVPLAATLGLMGLSMAGGWSRARDSLPLRLVWAGAFFTGLAFIQVLGLGLRSSASLLSFTPWAEALLVITGLGAATMWALAVLTYLRPPGRLGLPSFWCLLAGVAGLVGVLWLSGLVTGLGWNAAPVSTDFTNFGEGFVNTTGRTVSLDYLRVVAWAAIVVGAIGLLASLRGNWRFPQIERVSSGAVAPERGTAVAIGAWGLAFVTTVLIPFADGADRVPSLLAVTWRDYSSLEDGQPSRQAELALEKLGITSQAVAGGREIYVREGCFYCHTQSVRAVVTDVGLGAVTTAADLAYESPEVTGMVRLGPDLMHAGARPQTDDPAWLISHLSDPRQRRPWSTMPSYHHLSQDDLEMLAGYLISLNQVGAK